MVAAAVVLFAVVEEAAAEEQEQALLLLEAEAVMSSLAEGVSIASSSVLSMSSETYSSRHVAGCSTLTCSHSSASPYTSCH